MSFRTIITLIIITLIALNVYQYRNPQVVEVPGEQTAIDSTAWVQRSAYADRGVLLDSIEARNEKLAAEIRKTRDKISLLTNINGRLNLQVDSLYAGQLVRHSLPDLSAMGNNYDLSAGQAPTVRDGLATLRRTFADTSYNFVSVFGDGLFRVDSEVRFVQRNLPESGRSWQSSGERLLQDPDKFVGVSARSFYIENNLDITQLRDIEISVVNTMNDDRSRLLTYVTSEDFETLEYQTYTELEPRKRWPWFLIGTAIGVTGGAIILN